MNARAFSLAAQAEVERLERVRIPRRLDRPVFLRREDVVAAVEINARRKRS